MIDQTPAIVACVACKHWSLRDAPAMARHGFGVCQQDKHPGVAYSGAWGRVCLRFAPLPEAEVAKRQAWIESKKGKA